MVFLGSARGAGRVFSLGLILVALHPVQVVAQKISVGEVRSEVRSVVLNPGDSLHTEGAREFLPEWHAGISNIPGDWLRFARIAFTSRYAPIMAGTAGLAAAFAAYGFIAGDNRALRTGSQIVETILASGTVVQVLKHITGRESPFV